MTSTDFSRYSCQLQLPRFGKIAQEKLQQASVLIVGAGGLGCPIVQYLTASGIGEIGIVDDDVISISNLHRQILYAESEVGEKKVVVATKKLSQQNPSVNIIPFDIKVVTENVLELIKAFDIIVDATDNFESHYLINDACVLSGKPLVFGAIYQYEGQVAVWNVQNANGSYSPNYRDVFPKANTLRIPDCTDGGVLPTIAGIIGCMQANEVIKLITGLGEILKSKFLVFDASNMNSHTIRLDNETNTLITTLNNEIVIQKISGKEFDKILNKENYLLVDVRTNEEYQKFNIGGLNIPITTIEEQQHLLEGEQPIIFICASGKRSLIVAKWLKEKMPLRIIMSLEGGLNQR